MEKNVIQYIYLYQCFRPWPVHRQHIGLMRIFRMLPISYYYWLSALQHLQHGIISERNRLGET